MQSSHPRRLGAVVVPVIAGAFLLASCGAADNAATQSTIDLSAASTAFVVRPPATTDPGCRHCCSCRRRRRRHGTGVRGPAQRHADRCGEDVQRARRRSDRLQRVGHPTSSPTRATPSRSRPVARRPEPRRPKTRPPTAADPKRPTPAGTIPDAGDNCDQGDYTIAEGDFEGKVASNFDVTVEALRAANASTPNYSSFYPGLVIVIPAKADC